MKHIQGPADTSGGRRVASSARGAAAADDGAADDIAPATAAGPNVAPVLSERDKGIVAGLLIAEGSFGGDGRQPQLTLKMHVRHERLLRWLAERFPRTKLYGPYEHGDRVFFQWMARGRALVQDVLPVLDDAGFSELDGHAAERLARMRERYADYISRLERLG